MTATAQSLEDLTLVIREEVHVNAPLETTFEALLEQIGPENRGPNDSPLPLKVEPWPGGRWFRDLGDGNGHLWAHVQAIKKPTLLEFTGPLFMSCPVQNNLQYRLSEVDGGTLITFHHKAVGVIDEAYRTGVSEGWREMHARVKAAAEAR